MDLVDITKSNNKNIRRFAGIKNSCLFLGVLALLKCAAVLEVAFSVKKGGVTQILKYVTLMRFQKHSPSKFFFTYKTGKSWRRTVKEGLGASFVACKGPTGVE